MTKDAGGMSPYLIALIVITTTLAVAAAAIYFGGYADDILEWYAEKYYKAKAKAEFVALQNTGSEKAQDFLKSELKDNPVTDAGEVDEIAEGLGGDKLKKFGL